MNLMHSSTASLLCESSTTTGGADCCCCRLLLCLAGVQSGEAAAAFLVADDEDRNALTMLTLTRLYKRAAVHRAVRSRREPQAPRTCRGRSRSDDGALRPDLDARESMGVPAPISAGLILVHSFPFLLISSV
jgi:hypothetical protein